MRDQVFVSYSHEDNKYLDKLEKHLKPFEQSYRIKYWIDTRIEAGADWNEEIQRALASAKVAVLLVSEDFLASEFITRVELPELLRASEEEGLDIIWVYITPCAYHKTAISKFQCVNSPEHPLESLEDWEVDEIFVTLCELIEKKLTVLPADAESTALPGRVVAGGARSQAAVESFRVPAGGTSKDPAEQMPQYDRASGRIRKRYIYFTIAATIASLGIGSILLYSKLNHSAVPAAAKPLPVRDTPLYQRFDNLSRWTKPPGWTIDDKHRLVINGQKELGFLAEDFFADFDVKFHLKLIDSGGAAWALRVQDSANYYLFYLSGPKGTRPNTFTTYKVIDDIPKEEDSLSVANVGLEEEGQYDIEANVTKSTFITRITPATGPQAGETITIGEYTDQKNTFPVGSIGLRAFAGGKFSIADLNVWPPNTRITN